MSEDDGDGRQPLDNIDWLAGDFGPCEGWRCDAMATVLTDRGDRWCQHHAEAWARMVRLVSGRDVREVAV